MMLTGRRYRCIPQFSHQCSRCAMFLFGNDSYSTQALASRPGNKRRRLESGRLASSVSSSSAADSARLVANLPDEEFEFNFDPDAEQLGKEKQRLDAFLSSRLPAVSRAKLQSGIKDGLVKVNGRPQKKASHQIKWGDTIVCKLPPSAQLDAMPEDIPLEIVYEDIHVLVVNKAAGMVVHPSPGHETGTLVNALLHHCRLPPMRVVLGNPLPQQSLTEDVPPEDDSSEETIQLASISNAGQMPVIRPGIVHRLDKGTTGLMVVAKDDFTHANLCKQFKEHSVQRTYQSITIGVPKNGTGRVETNIARDPRDRLRMSVCGFHSNRGRHAISHYKVLGELAACKAAHVQWKLETGRTHQIRVHAKHIGHPILADEAYSGGSIPAAAFIGSTNSTRRQTAQQIVKALGRPALHAKTLGFVHPVSKENLHFDSELPLDFSSALERLSSF